MLSRILRRLLLHFLLVAGLVTLPTTTAAAEQWSYSSEHNLWFLIDPNDPGAGAALGQIPENAPAHVTVPGQVQFEGQEYLVTRIANRAAAMATNTTSVTLPDTLITIDTGAFSEIGLTSVDLGTSVQHIGNSAFYGNQLTSVTIPNSVTSIASYAFTTMRSPTSPSDPASPRSATQPSN